MTLVNPFETYCHPVGNITFVEVVIANPGDIMLAIRLSQGLWGDGKERTPADLTNGQRHLHQAQLIHGGLRKMLVVDKESQGPRGELSSSCGRERTPADLTNGQRHLHQAQLIHGGLRKMLVVDEESQGPRGELSNSCGSVLGKDKGWFESMESMDEVAGCAEVTAPPVARPALVAMPFCDAKGWGPVLDVDLVPWMTRSPSYNELDDGDEQDAIRAMNTASLCASVADGGYKELVYLRVEDPDKGELQSGWSEGLGNLNTNIKPETFVPALLEPAAGKERRDPYNRHCCQHKSSFSSPDRYEDTNRRAPEVQGRHAVFAEKHGLVIIGTKGKVAEPGCTLRAAADAAARAPGPSFARQ
ncbi:hypothetical protein BDZ88DRAFT_440210 [Geranomyces variabilis]|nr:hypothetical protein BDZ88DRAFT_440210 [Geranomyces variabilis]